jgi:Holliday junction resolvase
VKNTSQAGRARERQVAEVLRDQGYVVAKTTSYGVCDLVALRRGDVPLLVECKANRGSPYMHFRATDREVLLLEAERAGARAVLAHWAPRRPLRLIPSTEWPAA